MTELSRLAADLGRSAVKATELLDVVVRKTAADVQATAQQLVPVDTGNLKNSIGTDARRTATGAEADIGPTAEYGAYVEYGTSRMAPQPYMGPALTAHEDAFEQAIAQAMGRLL